MAVHLPDGSRVRREPHARFCERLEVKSLRPTLPIAGWSRMIPPYGPGASMTFWAAVPVLAGIFALFLLRDRDRLLSFGR